MHDLVFPPLNDLFLFFSGTYAEGIVEGEAFGGVDHNVVGE
jgi:hypothetical protein